ncbi:glycosyltransferase [Microbacterium foliorum]|uniref:glycosyltransferase n=1 Tax=Microbacterium foliorum TaxID=104336 RepID=UPI001D2B0CB6|nr:glycosyltransferase [Microbacterium foliorum]CAH0138874.1 Phosphatidyl-myo-inositol mannosyltransferase [Microbacterium foliorum]CAH0222523.1 Phosphatidyl-myo-inositol mannosyltransferase [Microbacterium foliorum]
MSAVQRLRVLVVAPERHPLRQPHAGGLEAVVWNRVRWLRRRGHDVELCAAEGSDFLGGTADFLLPSPRWERAGDVSDSDNPVGHRRRMTDAFARVQRRLAEPRRRVDVVDNHSLHSDPILWSRDSGVPVVTTLHTPPLPEMVKAARSLPGSAPHRFLAVSQYTARAWSAEGVDAFVFPNGVDSSHWRRGAGGDGWVWFGRIVPEKAPHLAIEAARRAGARLRIAGRIGDPEYFAREVQPRLGDGIEYLGALRQPELCDLVGASSVALVTPVWSEPFGLVMAEALMTGTPVVAFDSGGASEVLAGLPGCTVVPAGDVDALARAATVLSRGSESATTRDHVRAGAAARHSVARRHREIERVLSMAAQGAARAGDPIRAGETVGADETVGAVGA